MNDQPDELTRQIDRLVDGELSTSEKQTLVSYLDTQPILWRRCALAFLEAQAWSGDLVAPCDELAPVLPKQTAAQKLHSMVMLSLAMAASFALALGLSQWWQSQSVTTPQDGPPTIVQSPPQETPPVEEVAAHPLPEEVLENITLLIDDPDGGPPREMNVPVQQGEFDPQRLLAIDEDAPWAVQVEKQLRNTGHELHRERHLVPVWLDDGRRVVLPVEDIRIVPISVQNFQ